MKSILAAVAIVLILGSTAYGGWYYGPRAVYYPAPVYAYPGPVYSYAGPTWGYSPYATYYRPYMTYSPIVGPVVEPAPVWVGPRGRVYYPGLPARRVLVLP
jgi:hypothetical protein